MKTRFGPTLKPVAQGRSPQKLNLYPTEERRDVRADNLLRDKVKLLAHSMVQKKLKR